MKNIFYIITIISLSVLTLNKSFAYSYYNQYSGSYSDEQFRTDIKSYLDDEKWRQEKKDLEDLINNSSYNNSYTRNQTNYEKTYNDFKKTQQENEELYKKTLNTLESITKQNIELEQKTEAQKVYNNSKAFCQSYKDKYENGEIVFPEEMAKTCLDYNVVIIENQQTDNEPAYKVSEQTKNTITLKEAIQRRKDIENNKAKNTSTLNEILSEPKKVSTSTPATTSIIMPDTEIKQPIYKKVFNKIKSWFRF